MNSVKKILFVSTMNEDWGGSEELWCRTIPHLLKMNYNIAVCKATINFEHPEFIKLMNLDVELVDLGKYAKRSRQSITEPFKRSVQIFKSLRNTPQEKDSEDYDRTYELGLLAYLKQHEVSLAVIAQGINFDGLGYGNICLAENVPYALLAQKAAEIHWPSHIDRAAMRNVYLNAKKAYFVSKHNCHLTEEQFSIHLRNTEIVCNPVKVKRYPRAYPGTQDGFRLACVGRYFLLDKGQDILIRILSQQKWKHRPLSISFIGAGIDELGLKELAKFCNLENAEFLGYQQNIEDIWDNFHALILPSRFEGSPLALLEAMACGRTAIASNAGGISELICDGHTGFLGEPTVKSFDEAMERAWDRRHDWKQMGSDACDFLQEKVPPLPELKFAQSLDSLCNEKLISVIIPTYNRAAMVEKAITSVLAQTYPFVQIIVADDGSTDETSAICDKYPQVNYLKLAHGGQAHARNEGLKFARGEFIASLDSDDTWEPQFLERCFEIIGKNELDFVFTNWMEKNETNENIERFSMCKVLKDVLAQNTEDTVLLDNMQLRQLYLTGCPSPSSSLLINRKSLRSNWSSEFKIADDWCLLMDMIYTRPCKAGFTQKVLWTKNRDGKNIYDGKDRMEVMRDLWVHDMSKLFSRFKAKFTKEETERIKLTLSRNYLQHSYYELRMKKRLKSSIKYSFLSFLANKKAGSFAFLSVIRKIKNFKKRSFQFN
ncbi:glycosyltransferase [Autumnicola musiva]|uniref:Glycosyltransferase n=1 Tax=Autumnicola musiva TaxID=3075589 RepID=A0ABU3D2E2_9FLAO|nr:glycosyltransferase [Zunongwangia sp. F117]MDT0675697.1 glycosyltransferase [Zunongwangia sp. F117]